MTEQLVICECGFDMPTCRYALLGVMNEYHINTPLKGHCL